MIINNIIISLLEALITIGPQLGSNQSFDIFLFFVPIITYSNTDTEKSKILKDNKGKAGIYQWVHNKSKKFI
jgi:hypothetical protein